LLRFLKWKIFIIPVGLKMKFDTDKKKFLLEKSRTFCMVPWITIHTKPVGDAMPCCIANPEFIVGTSHKQSLMEIVNSPLMNRLRLDMLNERESKPCVSCYKHEDEGIHTFRNTVNKEYGQYFTESLKDTKPDGSLKNFKMRYFDIRFDNICNFKCRTCSPEYSSQWEQENRKQGIPIHFEKGTNKPEFIQGVLDQVDNMECVYFAGGEPLITEEHYLILEELLRKNKKDTELRYNTNLSNLKFKDKNIIELWRQFNKPVQVYASIDHYGDRANYIRHGTIKWSNVESNLIELSEESSVDLHFQTVMSIFNSLTLDDFFRYLREIGVHGKKKKLSHPIFMMYNPRFLTSQILPKKLKDLTILRIKKLAYEMEQSQFHKHSVPKVKEIENWIYAFDLWFKQKSKFREEIERLDKLRGESFENTFPELAGLLSDEKQNIFTATK